MREKIVEQIAKKYAPMMGENDTAYLGRMFATPAETYVNRLRAIGFEKMEAVLDAGSGFGQWTMELAGLNRRVCAVDIMPHRLMVLEEIARGLGVKNIEARYGRLEELGLPDSAFDGVFCYGVIFCTDWRRSLRELARVLRPGGRMYLMAAGVGWYVHLWKNRPNAVGDYDPRQKTAEAFWNTFEYEQFARPPRAGQVIIEPADMEQALKESNLAIVQLGADGTIHLDRRTPPPKPFFKGEYYGELGVYEVLAEKARGENR